MSNDSDNGLSTDAEDDIIDGIINDDINDQDINDDDTNDNMDIDDINDDDIQFGASDILEIGDSQYDKNDNINKENVAKKIESRKKKKFVFTPLTKQQMNKVCIIYDI